MIKNFLEKPRIEPVQAKTDSTIADLIGIYRASGAFQGGRLGEAALLYQKMINSDTTVGLTLSGAMTPAGMGGLIIQLMEYGFVDMIISTGANLYHDMHFALDLAVLQGDFQDVIADVEQCGAYRLSLDHARDVGQRQRGRMGLCTIRVQFRKRDFPVLDELDVDWFHILIMLIEEEK